MPLAKPFMELSVFDLFIYTVKSFFFLNYGIGFLNSFALRIHVLRCLFCLAACENSKIAGFPVTHTVRPSTSEGSKWSSWGRLPPILPHLLIECACDGKSQNGKMANGEWWMANGEWQPAMESRVSDGVCRHCQVVSLRVVGFILLTFTRSPCLQI